MDTGNGGITPPPTDPQKNQPTQIPDPEANLQSTASVSAENPQRAANLRLPLPPVLPGKNISDATLRKLFKQAKLDSVNKSVSPVVPNIARGKRQRSSDRQNGAEQADFWQQPKRPVRKATLRRRDEFPPLQNDNRFNQLHNIPQNVAFEHPTTSTKKQRNSSDIETSKPKQSAGNNDSASAARSSPAAVEEDGINDSPDATRPSSKQARPPPIYTSEISFKDLVELLKGKISKNKFIIRETKAGDLSLFTVGLDNFETAKKILADGKVKFFTYTPKSSKPKNLVLKGIRGEYSEAEVQQEISELQLPQVTVTKVTRTSFNNNIKSSGSSHFIVQLSADSDARALSSVKNLLYQRVRWERLRKPSIFLCTNCFQTSHSSANCQLASRCGRCKEAHSKDACTFPKDCADRKKMYCINCEETGHSSSYRGCPFLKYAQGVRYKCADARRAEKEEKYARASAQVAQGSAPGPRPASSSARPAATAAAAWGGNDASGYLFSNAHGGANINSVLADLESRLAGIIERQFNSLINLINKNSERINFIYDNWTRNDGY